MDIGKIVHRTAHAVKQGVDTVKTTVDTAHDIERTVRTDVDRTTNRFVDKTTDRLERALHLKGPPGPIVTTRGAKDISSHAHLPANASPLMRGIYADTVKSVGRGNVPAGIYATRGNAASADVMIKGPEIFGGMANLIRGAKHEVAMQTFEWESGSDAAKTVSKGFKDLERSRKAACATEPVKVKIMVNQFSIGWGRAGQRQHSYDDLKKDIAALKLDPRYVQVELVPHRHRITGANHSKSLVVDGNRAIIGGANVQRQAGTDTAYRVDGDAALALRSDIADTWHEDKQHGDHDFDPLPLPSRVGRAPKGGDVPMMVLTRPADGHLLSEWTHDLFHRHDDTDNPADRAFLSVFKRAQREIHVMSPNLNDDAAKNAMLDAAKRGVKVQIVVPRHFNDATEVKLGQGGTNEQNVKKMLASLPPAARKNLQIKWFNGLSPGSGHEQVTSHTKYLTADGQIAIVGSSNMDTQSWNHSRETNLLVDSAEVTAKWEAQVFGPAFARGTHV